MDVFAGILNKLVIATPFLLVTTLGLKAREQRHVYSYTSYSQIEERNISAYVPLVKATEAVYDVNDCIPRPEAGKLARMWIQGSKSGDLKPLPQITIDDSTRDGVKSQILRDAEEVSESMAYWGGIQLSKGDYQQASQDALTALEVLRTPRMFDYSSVSSCSIPQRRALEIIRASMPHLPAGTQASIRKQVHSFVVPDQDFTGLTMDARSVLLKFEDSPNAGFDNYNALEKYISPSNRPTIADLRKTGSVPLGLNSDDGLIDLVSEFRLGYATGLDMNNRYNAI